MDLECAQKKIVMDLEGLASRQYLSDLFRPFLKILN